MTDGTAIADHAGLTSAEVAERTGRGAVNRTHDGATRTLGEIVRANVMTRFNLLITALLVVILLVAPVQDALFGIVMVVNAAIGIVQEVRAKRTLDRLTLLAAPRARVIRDGVSVEVPAETVVLDDLVELAPGDQLVVDAVITDSTGLEVDESLLTGESDPVAKVPGDRCRSGTFVVAGSGRCVAEAVGPDSYAARLAHEARRFTLVRSELRRGIDRILTVVGWLLVPTIGLLAWSQVAADQPIDDAVAGAVAGTVAAVPQGLVLLTSLAFAVSVIRLGRRSVLVRELPAVEGLARADTVCFDKTGTLTVGRLTLRTVEPIGDRGGEAGAAAAALATADPAPNATLRAIAAGLPAPPGWTPRTVTPFSSARGWSGATFEGRGTYVLGAPEVITPDDAALLERVGEHAAAGWRVLVVGRMAAPVVDTPSGAEPVGLVVLGDEVRPQAGAALEYLAGQGVQAKVISGDHPRTVAAIAARAGMPGADAVGDGAELPEDPEALADVVERTHVFGRVTPAQKRRMIAALRRRGRVVAMVGDGVNDVPALKDADLGIAMGTGSAASRAVAQVVLLDGDFDALPDVVAEGRRVASNIERVANLFLTKTVYAFLLAAAVAIVPIAFPFLPRHLTLVGSLTIGIPAFALAMEPTSAPIRPGFVGRAARFAVPTGAVAATATFLAYLLSRSEGVGLTEGRTVATVVLGAVGLMALAMVARPPNDLRRVVLAGTVLGFVLVFLVPQARTFFALDLPRPVVALAAIGVIAVTGGLLRLGLQASGWVEQLTAGDIEADGLRRLLDRLRPGTAQRRRGPPAT